MCAKRSPLLGGSRDSKISHILHTLPNLEIRDSVEWLPLITAGYSEKFVDLGLVVLQGALLHAAGLYPSLTLDPPAWKCWENFRLFTCYVTC